MGWESNEHMSMDALLQQTMSKVKYMRSHMSNLQKYMNERQKLRFTNAYMISILQYGVQFLLGDRASMCQSHHAAVMMVAR